MRQHDRYLLRELIVPFWIGLLAFLMMLVGNTLFQVLDQMMRDKWPVAMVVRALLFNIPTSLQYALPVACALAPALAITRLARDTEVTALRGAGISLRRLAAPVAAFGLVAGVGGAALTERAVPWAWREQNNIEGWLANLPISSLESSLTFSLDSYTLSWWRMRKTGPGAFRMEEVTVIDRGSGRPGEPVRSYTADWGEYRGGVWSLHGVAVHAFDVSGATLWDARVETWTLPLAADFTRGMLHFGGEQLQNLSFVDLTDQWRRTGDPGRRLELDTARWFKFAIPLLCAPLALLSVPLALRFARAGGFAGVLIALTLTLAAQIALFGAQGLALSGRTTPIVAAAAPAMGALALALILLRGRE